MSEADEALVEMEQLAFDEWREEMSDFHWSDTSGQHVRDAFEAGFLAATEMARIAFAVEDGLRALDAMTSGTMN